MKQMLVFTNAYGVVIIDSEGVSKPEVKYESIHEYLAHGWRVASFTGTGIGTSNTGINRGLSVFCLNNICRETDRV